MCGDLLEWAEEASESPVDLIHSAFAIHHLSDPDKVRFFKGAHRRIAERGLLVWTDVFQESNESREAYLNRYVARVRQWPGLTVEQREAVITHMGECDLPARREWIESVVADCGWSLTWAWRGQHRAEATALLRPCP